ncbi:O-antigen ligase family protein [Taibaiella soli]|nr:O-antigen ligase family protein [Taibaiella soli]
MILFGLNGIRDVQPKEWLKQRWWLFGLIWVLLYAVSWFWSDNKHEWNVLTQVKLPFLIMPLAFAFLPAFSQKQLRVFTAVFNLLMLCGIAYSMGVFLRDYSEYVAGYGYSKVMPTPAYNDHITFSAVVTLCIVWNVYIWRVLGKGGKWLAAISIALLAAYLHVLAAKTGLVALYLFVIFFAVYLVLRRHAMVGISLIAVLAIGVFLANRYVPTFNKRLNYINFAYDRYQENVRSGDYGDIGRIMSYELSTKIIEQHPLTGVGAGDMLDEMKKSYDQYYPQVPDDQRLLPHNQFLVIALGVGIPALVFFLLWMFAPFRRLRKNRESAFFLFIWSVLMVPLMVDPTLEIQLGVFVFTFFFLWQRHLLIYPPQKESVVS